MLLRRMDYPENLDAFMLKTVIFFDSLGFGIMYPHINPHLLDMQGTQLYAGIFTALNLICSLLSEEFTTSLISFRGRKFGAYLIFMISIVTHICVVITESVILIMISRLIFTLVNEANSFCKELFLKVTPPDTHEKEVLELSLLSSIGYILGPAIGGYIFALPGGFTLIGLVTAAITFGNVLLLLRVNCALEDYQPDETLKESDIIKHCIHTVEKCIDDFNNCDYINNWPFLAVQFLFTSGWTMFFIKFTQVLYSNFNVGSITFGLAGAYKNILIFSAATSQSIIQKNFLNKFTLITRIECCLIIHMLTMFVICYSQGFVLYFVLCIPLILTKTLLNSYWQDFYNFCENFRISNLIPAINVLSGIIVPIIFGLLCTVVCPNIVKFIACSCLLSSYMIYAMYIKPLCF